MIRSLFTALFAGALLLSGCTQLEQENLRYPLNVNTHLSGNRLEVRVNSPTKGPVKQAQIQVIDEDTQQVIVDAPLNNNGLLRFRVPSLSTRLTVLAVDNEGNEGRRLLTGDELMNDDIGSGQ
ncbi:hypothetical protein MIB92_02045 [Aestuariirhabdus sp. Z084]|uniref:hypothetical protein n=1 Tax=Aestuariirhabdus haliotis TaxID=2918751 RepID=UPI00201B3635|nr:hypothetical protein [Aestuariirhabdus haliotis]MCL6414421.1 hypothetical protein [Aestuariirhabdus haliotis]MCL6418597.1 hypothetical protein [Aestuariirhabdus haliotis]